MGILSWLLLGLIVGALGKWIMPGKDPGGILVTMAIGIAGAVVGGFIGSLLGLGAVSGFDLRSLALATGGAVLGTIAAAKRAGFAYGATASSKSDVDAQRLPYNGIRIVAVNRAHQPLEENLGQVGNRFSAVT